jgi:hypothetical protein
MNGAAKYQGYLRQDCSKKDKEGCSIGMEVSFDIPHDDVIKREANQFSTEHNPVRVLGSDGPSP